MNSKNVGLGACVLLAIAPWALGGCAMEVGDEDTSSTAEEVIAQTQIQEIDFGTTKRWVRLTASKFCDGWKITHPKPGFTAKGCNHYGYDFTQPTEVGVYETLAAANAGTPFPAHKYEGWSYAGCGPQAVMNVLDYYGDHFDVNTIMATAVPTISVPFSDSLASSPNTVGSGLRTLLGYIPGAHTVTVDHDPDVRGTVRRELMKGNPVIALVHGGSHYQVVTGLSGNDYFVIDYGNSGSWVQESDLGLELGFPAAWGSLFSGGSGGYKDDTVVRPDYYTTPPLVWPSNVP